MLRPVRQAILLDSIAMVSATDADKVVVSGSHGGVSAAHFVLALAALPCAVFFNDAGIGKNNSGIAALDLLQQAGVIAATYSHWSACIGDAGDALENGVLSWLNPLALEQGLCAGATVRSAVEQLTRVR